MKCNPLPRAEYLYECLEYCAVSGRLTWRKRPRDHFSTAHAWNNWNSKHAGAPAFITVDGSGHLQSRIDYKLYFAHRVIWKMMTGEDPPGMLDHRDRNGANNRWKNLRLADYPKNGANHKVLVNNTSGHTGVSFSSSEGKWKAYIRTNGKRISLGTHEKKSDAIEARRVAEKKYHGEFAPQ